MSLPLTLFIIFCTVFIDLFADLQSPQYMIFLLRFSARLFNTILTAPSAAAFSDKKLT